VSAFLSDLQKIYYLATVLLAVGRDAAETKPSISSTLYPRGGADGTLPRWVAVLAVALWVSPEEVWEAYSGTQKSMAADPNPPKTQTRVFRVAQFVWQNEICRLNGELFQRSHTTGQGERLPYSAGTCKR
jgi:hypothetical protein